MMINSQVPQGSRLEARAYYPSQGSRCAFSNYSSDSGIIHHDRHKIMLGDVWLLVKCAMDSDLEGMIES